jgi:hypothetical protein
MFDINDIRNSFRNNITFLSILLFIIIYLVINYFKPLILYKKNGVLRDFGIGYKNKTILPCWLLTILLSILSYFSILYFISYPRLNY